MGGYLVAVLMLAAVVFGIYAWLRGDRDIFEDEFIFGATMLLIGVIGGAILGLTVSEFMSDHEWLPTGYWAPLAIAFAVWIGWGTLVFRFLSSNSGRHPNSDGA